MTTVRMLQLAEEIRDCFATMLVSGDIHDPRLKGMTVLSVKMTPDLKIAKIYYTCPSENQAKCKQGLAKAKGFVRKKVAEKIQIKFAPEVAFFFDDSISYSLKMSKILNDIKNERSDLGSESSNESDSTK